MDLNQTLLNEWCAEESEGIKEPAEDAALRLIDWANGKRAEQVEINGRISSQARRDPERCRFRVGMSHLG